MKKIYALLVAAVAAPTLMFAQPANSSCDTAPIADLVTDGPTVTVTGSGVDAINNEDELDVEHVWEAFSITECSNVTIDLCGTDSVQGFVYQFVTNACPIDLADASTLFIFDGVDFATCAEGNPTSSWTNLEPGTYYYPIVSSPDAQEIGDYTVNFTAVTCTGEPDTCLTYANGPYTDFNTAGGAPTPDEDGVCESVALTFGAWASESYTIDGFAADVMYTFSICDGTGAGSWSPALSVTDPDGNLVAYVEDCSVTWTTSMEGTYVIGISEAGNCFASTNTQTDNGNPTLSCEGSVGVSEVEKADFSIFPNPSNGQFSIRNAGEAGNYNIRVIDMAGRIVHSQKSILSPNSVVAVNVNDFAKGVYMVKMTNTLDNSATTQRVVVQ